VHLPSLPFVVLDTETTGLLPKVNHVFEFASVRVRDGKKEDEYEVIVAPPQDIPPTVRVLTRIAPDLVTGKPAFADVREQILSHLGSDTLIVGQNVGFDLKMLKGDGLDLTERPWVDTAMLASLVFPELQSFSLGYVSSVLGLHHEPVHRALGDVHATLELFGKCWERMTALPPDELRALFETFSLSSPGYRLLADALPTAPIAKKPKWLASGKRPVRDRKKTTSDRIVLPFPKKGTVDLMEDPLTPDTLQRLVETALADDSKTHWIAVKNLEASIRDLTLDPKKARVIFPAPLLLDPASADALLLQKNFTSDEATLSVKIRWYAPRAHRDLPIHGEERSVWYGRIACTEQSDTYRKQFSDLPSVVLIDHQQLFTLLASDEHVGHTAITAQSHIIITDASMLEDTATKAWQWQCVFDHMRAAAEGNTTLTGFLDLVQLWIARVRAFQDIRYLTPQDLESGEAEALRERIVPLLADTTLPTLVQKQLRDLQSILTPELLSHRIVWIEERQGGSQSLHSVPEHVGPILRSCLFETIPTTLILPPGSAATMREVLPSLDLAPTTPFPPFTLPLAIRTDVALDDLLRSPPQGKTVILVGSKRIIEEKFVEYTLPLEQKGVTLICQNLSGGLERMTAEFLTAPAPAVWLLTPWSYEEVDLPQETLDHLVIASLPFDHPSHTVLSRRAARYGNAFEDYFLPRLEARLFRLIRSFCRHRTFLGEVWVTDDRLKTKSYGKRAMAYLGQFAREEATPGKAQMELF